MWRPFFQNHAGLLWGVLSGKIYKNQEKLKMHTKLVRNCVRRYNKLYFASITKPISVIIGRIQLFLSFYIVICYLMKLSEHVSLEIKYF